MKLAAVPAARGKVRMHESRRRFLQTRVEASFREIDLAFDAMTIDADLGAQALP